MPFVPGAETPYPWQNQPSVQTPLDRTHLQAMETGIVNWTTAQIQSLDTFLETNLAPLTGATFSGPVTVPDLAVSGISGATVASRYVGATSGGAPGSGTFATGDFVVDVTGAILICTAGGTPGTWAATGGGAAAGVATFNTRAGAVIPASGDYTAAQVTNAADKSSGSQQAFTGEIAAPDFTPAGITGATAASRYVGATVSGAPASGTFSKGDWVVDQTGSIWVCTTAGTPGTWGQVGGGGLSGGTGGAGAQAATYGRTSTIATPTLRDFVSLGDYASGANGNGTTDDTSIFTSAITALNNKGGGTLLLPVLNPAGNQATWTAQRIAINGTTNITVSAYGARMQYVSNSAGGAIWKSDGTSGTPNVYNVTGFKLLGLTVAGTGNENALQPMLAIDRGTDITIRDCNVTLWNGAVFNLYDVQRTRVENNTCQTCTHGGANVINISVQNTFNGSTVPLNDIIVKGNVVVGCNTAPVAISTGSPAPTSTLMLSTIWFQGNPPSGTAPTGGGTDVSFTQKNFFNGVINSGSTSVTGVSPSQPVGLVYSVTGLNIPAATTLTITGTGTTGTLSNAATAGTSLTISFTQTATFSTSGTAIAYNATAAQVQTALQTAITAGGGPTSAVTCYAGPLGQSWSGSTPPSAPVWIVFASNMPGFMVNLTTTDAYTGGTAPQSVFTYPQVRLIVSENHLESNSLAAFDLEIGGSAAGGGVSTQVIHDVIVSNNHLAYVGGLSGSNAALVLSADAVSPPVARGDLFRRVLIVGNDIQSNSDGALLNGQDITFQSNTVKAARYGVKVQPTAGGPNDTTATTWSNTEALSNPNSNVHIKGGVIRMTDSAANAAGISFNGVTDSSIDVPVYWDTGAKGTSEGIFLQNCLRIDVKATVTNAPERGIRLSSCGDIYIQPGTRILNPSANGTTTGIRIDGTLTDNIHIDGVTIRDSRGSHVMTYGIDTASATLNGFGVYERNGRILGWATGALTGTFALGGLNDIWDTTGVVYTAGKRVTWVSNAAPTSGTWGVGDIAWNLAPAAGGTSFWMCTTAGTPGTWTAQAFTGAGGSTQGVVLAKGVNYTMLVTDSTVKATASAITITLPTAGLGSGVGMLTWQVKNASTGNVTVSSGTAGIIDNFSGGNGATTYTVIAGDAAVFQLDTNFVDWLLV